MAWMHYNPHRADAALLDALTAGDARVRLRDELLEVVRSETARTSHQHQLLIGARGAGKTHLLRVVAYRVGEDPALRAAWWPVVLPEEQGLRGPAELLTALLDKLTRELEGTEHANARAVGLEARALVRAAGRGIPAMEAAGRGLAKVAAALDRKLLCVVENLDALFYLGVGGGRKEAGKEQWALRKHLQDGAHLLLFGAAPTHFGAASDSDAAFHGFFRQHVLEALPLDEVLAIAKRHLELLARTETDQARKQRAAELVERFDTRKGKLAGMLRVTGGLPRFAHLIVELLVDSTDADTEVQLERLLDEQTPYFQGRLDPRLVPSGELELLATLARAEGPLRPSEAARRVGVTSGEVSVMLERLRERGLVRRSGSEGSITVWDVAEPLYRVWMAFREGGEQRNDLLALGAVVAGLYDQEELEAERARSAAGANGAAAYRPELLDAALSYRPAPNPATDRIGENDEAYQAAKLRLDEARAAGEDLGQPLVDYLCFARWTGRAICTAEIEDALKATRGDEALHAMALECAAFIETGSPVAPERFAASAEIYRRRGDKEKELELAGHRAQAVALLGRRQEAAEILNAALSDPLAESGELGSWLHLNKASYCAGDEAERLAHLSQALRFAKPGAISEANARRRLADCALDPNERIRHADSALLTYEKEGWHRERVVTLEAKARAWSDAHELPRAAEAYFEAVDAMLQADVLIHSRTWLELVAMATWLPSHAPRALRLLAAATNRDPESDLRTHGEATLLEAATQLLAVGAYTTEERYELLAEARNDLHRERRGLLEPFVLAARVEADGSESALLQQSEQMRGVVGDVLARVKRLRKKRPSRPAWLTPTAA